MYAICPYRLTKEREQKNNLPLLFFFLFLCDNQGTFHGQAFRTLYGDLNLEQQPPGKFRVSSITRFEPKTMCHLVGPHFPMFAPPNWVTLASNLPLLTSSLANQQSLSWIIDNLCILLTHSKKNSHKRKFNYSTQLLNIFKQPPIFFLPKSRKHTQKSDPSSFLPFLPHKRTMST